VNTCEPWPELETARARVLEIQTKLHQWAGADRQRRFDDLYNLVADPAFLVTAWIGSGRTRAPAQQGWMGERPTPSK
jgi:hypothetical protein